MVVRQQAGGSPAATHFLLSRQKKVSTEKATLLSASPFACATGATCGARSSRGRAQLASLRQSLALIRLALRSSAHTEGGWDQARDRSRERVRIRHRAPARMRKARPRLPESAPAFVPPPVGLGRGAQPKADQGERLSERSEFELDPAFTEHRRLPRSAA